MVLCTEDILEEFEYLECMNNNIQKDNLKRNQTNFSVFKGLSTEEIRIAKIISKGIHHIDEIISRCNISTKEANNILFMLEMKGVITQQPGKLFDMYY